MKDRVHKTLELSTEKQEERLKVLFKFKCSYIFIYYALIFIFTFFMYLYTISTEKAVAKSTIFPSSFSHFGIKPQTAALAMFIIVFLFSIIKGHSTSVWQCLFLTYRSTKRTVSAHVHNSLFQAGQHHRIYGIRIRYDDKFKNSKIHYHEMR